MRKNTPGFYLVHFAIVCTVILALGLANAYAGGKIGIYGIRMVPNGIDAEKYSRAGWGVGFHIVAPVPQLSNILAGVGGIEFVNLLDNTTEFNDNITGLRIEQQTSQHYIRVILGAQVGGHGSGFIRPHAGVNLAFINYGISTDVVVPDDEDYENEIRQNLSSEDHWVVGYGITFGIDLNFSNTVAVDGGVRFLKSFAVPQQLGEGSVKVHPQYFQVYLGIGLSFDMIFQD
jgi:opacity protein-like surface antigen